MNDTDTPSTVVALAQNPAASFTRSVKGYASRRPILGPEGEGKAATTRTGEKQMKKDHVKPPRDIAPVVTTLHDFCGEFGVDEKEFGTVLELGRRFYLVNDDQPLLATIERLKKNLFSAGVYLGEEKQRFEPSAALLELISRRTTEHKAIVDEKAAWLFLCDRDILDKGVVKMAEPTKAGFLLVQNEQDENLGFGLLSKKRGNMAVRNVLDRGNFLRRERFE